jgi:hypothetical protein
MKLTLLHTFQLFLLTGISLIWGCSKTSVEDIPSYIAIDTISVKVNSIQGSASHKVVDAWVYADNDLIGGDELPSRFPILKGGTTTLTIFAGIKLNGINETRSPYPFYQKITKTLTLVRDSVIGLGHLSFAYSDGTKFAWQENFEQYNLSIDTTARSEISLLRSKLPELATAFPSEANEYAAKIVIPNDSLVFECVTHNSFKLPTDGSSVFLEMNYKSNNPFTMGLLVNGSVASQRPVLIINPSSTWNKIYINLTPTVSFSSGASSFRVYFSAMKNTEEPNAEIMFDNLKLLHF